jgi:hypothetical protein
MMRPRALVGMAAVGVTLLAASARAAPSGTMEDVAADVVAQLHAAGTVAHERAAAIAALPSLAYAVATDQQTMLDMTADELSFHAQPGEIVEVAQAQLATGKVTSLRREGDGALVHLPLGATGLSFVVVGKALYAVDVVAVRPRSRANVVRGVVGVARAIDLASASAQLAELGGAAQLRIGETTLVFGHAPARATATTTLHPSLGANVNPELTMIAPPPHRAIGALMALAVVGLAVGFGVVVVRRRRVLAVHDDAYDRARIAAR